MSPRTLLLAVVLIAIAGCGDKAPIVPTGSALSVMKEPDTIAVPLQGARDLYATIRTIATDRIAYAQAKCKARALTLKECAQLDTDIGALKQLDFEVVRSLNSPKATLDVTKIAKILEVSSKIIGALIP